MAGPLLRTGGLREPIGISESGWANALSQAFKGISAGLDKRFDIKREEQQKFISALEFDINDVSNDLFKGYAVDQYRKLHDNWFNIYNEQKGWLTPEQKIRLQSDMNKYHSEVEYLNGISKYNGEAQSAAQKEPGIEYNSQKWLDFVKAVESGDVDNIREKGSMFLESDAGVPGTTLVPMNPYDAFLAEAPELMKTFEKKETGAGMEQKTENGVRIETPYTTYKRGDDESFRKGMGSRLANHKYAKNFDKFLSKNMTPEQQKESLFTVGNKVGDASRYWSNNMLEQKYVDDFTQEKKDYGTSRRIPVKKETGGTGTKTITPIAKTDIGWNFSSTPVDLIVDVDGQLRRSKARQILLDENGNYNIEVYYKQNNRDKSTLVPLEEYYDAMKAGFKRYPRGALQLEGFEGLEFKERPAPIEPEDYNQALGRIKKEAASVEEAKAMAQKDFEKGLITEETKDNIDSELNRWRSSRYFRNKPKETTLEPSFWL